MHISLALSSAPSAMPIRDLLPLNRRISPSTVTSNLLVPKQTLFCGGRDTLEEHLLVSQVIKNDVASALPVLTFFIPAIAHILD